MRTSKSIYIPLFAGFIIQVFTGWNSFFYHSDEYFQIVEFAAYKYNIAPVANLPWEYAAKIRPTLQIHFFALLYKCLTAIGIQDRFLIVSILSTLTGVAFFTVSNYLIVDNFKTKQFLVKLLWVNNFFWLVPYLRCRFSAEVVSAFFWISGVIILEKLLAKHSNYLNAFFLFLTGIIFSISFYCRFQIIFALIGLAIWFFINYKKEWKKAGIVFSGFVAGIAFNIVLDKLYYGQWVFTPYRYFYVNIIEGKANSFGISPWWTYIVLLMLAAIPFASFLLFLLFVKGLTIYKNPYALGSLFFIVAHSLVGHKEERFIFPVILVMVYLAAEAYDKSPSLAAKLKAAVTHSYFGWLVRGACYFSFVLNIMLIILLSFETYKQPVMFIKKFNSQPLSNQEVISFKQHPYETESGLRYTFLSENKYASRIHVIDNKERFIQVLQQHPYFKYCILLADARQNNLEYLLENRNAVVASSFIWKLAKWLAVKYDIIVPDLWICQTYNDVRKTLYTNSSQYQKGKTSGVIHF
ncbi:hypothetical protein [Segetibacter koreensis]|uniref:hypothetical protein n=1 Tax=Segetibacter koreensis TaxID=398037 RepID=UPI00037B1FD9|nr:hypothetical protein [Segetibacter koreensis]